MTDIDDDPLDDSAEEDPPGDGEEAGDGKAAPKKYGLNDDALRDQRFMVSDTDIQGSFGDRAYDGLKKGRSRWAVRFSGDGLDGPSADPFKTAALLRRVAMSARWMGNSLLPGQGSPTPGFVLGEASHSIVLEFTLAPEERSVQVLVDTGTAGDNEDLLEKRAVYPTVEGGRYFGMLLASAGEPDELIERFGLVGRRAVKTYEGALKEFAKFNTEVELLVPVAVDNDETDLRRVQLPVKEAESGLAVLERKPEVVSSTTEVEGLLYTQNALNAEFGIQKDNDAHVTGTYDIRVADKLGPAWNKRVWAQVEEHGPKQDWMPRAGRTERILVDVAVLKKGETRLKGTD
jgi:hypothetical protein